MSQSLEGYLQSLYHTLPGLFTDIVYDLSWSINSGTMILRASGQELAYDEDDVRQCVRDTAYHINGRWSSKGQHSHLLTCIQPYMLFCLLPRISDSSQVPRTFSARDSQPCNAAQMYIHIAP